MLLSCFEAVLSNVLESRADRWVAGFLSRCQSAGCDRREQWLRKAGGFQISLLLPPSSLCNLSVKHTSALVIKSNLEVGHLSTSGQDKVCAYTRKYKIRSHADEISVLTLYVKISTI